MPDGWIIEFGDGCKFLCWENETVAHLKAAKFHGTARPFAYLEPTSSQKPKGS